MRLLEVLLLVMITLWPFLGGWLKAKIKWHVVAGLFSGVLLLHFLVEGWRWQLIPAYSIVLFLLALVYLRRNASGLKWNAWRILASIPLLVLLFAAWFLPIALPVFDLPKPTGEYQVGTSDTFLALNRLEELTTDPSDKRELGIKLWYPTSITEGSQDPFWEEASRRGFERKYGLPAGILNYLDLIETNVWKEAEVADGTFPVLIFSHGYNSTATGYYALLSEIVSHGYIVININHTYESPASRLSNGEMAFFDYEYIREAESASWAIAEPIVTSFHDRSFEERHEDVAMLLKEYFVVDLIDYWVQDVASVLDELPAWNRSGRLAGHLNLNQIGTFGHSRGGSTAGTIIFEDDRLVATANLDGAQWGYQVDTSYQKPFLYVSSDWPPQHQNVNLHAYVNKGKNFYDAMLRNSGHSNFMDLALMIRPKQISQAGAIDPYEALKLASGLVVAFFDKHVKGREQVQLPEHENLELEIYQ